MKSKKIIKAISFLLIFLVGFFAIQSVLVSRDVKDYRRMQGFFEEREGSLDAVFLGSSATYAFWNPPVAFAEHGITVYSFNSAGQPTFAAKYLIEDAMKTQPDALYIINVTHLLEDYGTFIHQLLSNYPNSINKLEMTDYLCDIAGLSFTDRMEYYFPILRFHDRWSELTVADFNISSDKYKCGGFYKSYILKTTDFSGTEYDLETRSPLDDNNVKNLNDLMDYCEEKNAKVLFVIVPQTVSDPERFGKQNTTVDMLEERGFDVLDLRKCVDEIGIDFSKDFYNYRHTNIYGSLKVTDYISRYLIEHYGFEDKRGKEEFSDWTEAAALYYEAISPYITDEVRESLSISEDLQ